jgi:putative nucleotidyltransferase with HDIG domain
VDHSKKNKTQLIEEIEALQGQVTELERALAECKRTERELRPSYAVLRRTLDETIHALVAIAEKRDPFAVGHHQRVTRLACAIAKEISLSEEQIKGLRMAALIHDIGKTSVPVDVLAKPIPLSDLEHDLMKSHVQASYDMLKTIEFPWPVAEIVLQHHERLDGSGYPQGLSGDDILLEAKILAVADLVDIMTSRQPQRLALSIDEALEEISENRGRLYDPEVVDACLKLLTEKGFEFE